MKINEDKRVISGEHNGNQFILNDGVLDYNGRLWSKKEVTDLINLCNLLKIEGYELKESRPLTAEKRDYILHWGGNFRGLYED